MTDKTFSDAANPIVEGSLVDGLFKWTDVAAGAIGDPVYLKADGPPIEVGKAVNTNNYIGQLASVPAQNDMCKVCTKYTAIYKFTAGGTVVRGDYVRLDSASKVVKLTNIADATLAATFSDTAVEAALDALRDAIQAWGGKVGQALQSASTSDIIYVGLGG